MRVGTRVAAVVVVGLAVASPVGFAVGSQQGNGQSDPAVGQTSQSSEAYVPKEGIYAHISEFPTPDGVLDLCREKLTENPNDECGIFVQIEDARDKGLLQPGDYTKEEFDAILAAARS